MKKFTVQNVTHIQIGEFKDNAYHFSGTTEIFPRPFLVGFDNGIKVNAESIPDAIEWINKQKVLNKDKG